MRKIFTQVVLTLFIYICIVEVGFTKTKPLYKLSEKAPEKPPVKPLSPILTGTDRGLIRVSSNGMTEILWNEGSVSNIIKTQSKM